MCMEKVCVLCTSNSFPWFYFCCFQKVVDGAKVGNWACINFCRNLAKPAVDKFCSDLVKWSCNTGVVICIFIIIPMVFILIWHSDSAFTILLWFQHMDNLKLPVYLARPEQVEADLRMCYQDARNKLRGHKIDLLLAILPEKNGSLYGNTSSSKVANCFFTDYVMPCLILLSITGNIKRICETDIGIMSQCCLDRHVTRAGPPYFANVAIKINAKVDLNMFLFTKIVEQHDNDILTISAVWRKELRFCKSPTKFTGSFEQTNDNIRCRCYSPSCSRWCCSFHCLCKIFISVTNKDNINVSSHYND